MIDCLFELNGQAMSVLKCGAIRFPAFSGLGENVNKRSAACRPNQGPIPSGTYYIVARQSGGVLGPFRDLFTGRDQWFALYAIDQRIDDETYCADVKRGLFRLHPKGPFGRSEGCIVVERLADFQQLSAMLKGASQQRIPGTDLEAYGRLIVK